MDVRQLRAFVTVAEERNFTRAADRLNITQPPLSRQIMDLEAQLGMALFARRGRRQVTLTAAGKIFLRKARQILEQMDKSLAEMRLIEAGKVGELHAGFVDDVMFGPLADHVGGFLKQHPDVFLDSCVALSPVLCEMVVDGRLDVAVVEPPLPIAAQHLQTCPLPSERFVIAVPVDHPLAGREQIRLAELKDERFTVTSAAPATSFALRVDRLFEQAGIAPHIAHVGHNSILNARIAARAGHLTIVGAGSVPVLPDDYRTIAIARTERETDIDLILIWSDQNSNGVLHRFIDHLRDAWRA